MQEKTWLPTLHNLKNKKNYENLYQQINIKLIIELN